MHSRLLPLNPPPLAHVQTLSHWGMPRLILPSMPWLELGFFAVMIVGLVTVGA